MSRRRKRPGLGKRQYVVECAFAVFFNVTRHEWLFFVIYKCHSFANHTIVFVLPRDRVCRLNNLPPNYSKWTKWARFNDLVINATAKLYLDFGA